MAPFSGNHSAWMFPQGMLLKTRGSARTTGVSFHAVKAMLRSVVVTQIHGYRRPRFKPV